MPPKETGPAEISVGRRPVFWSSPNPAILPDCGRFTGFRLCLV